MIKHILNSLTVILLLNYLIILLQYLVKHQSILKKELMKETSQCLITGWNNPKECECAHIVPKRYGYNMRFYDVNKVSECDYIMPKRYGYNTVFYDVNEVSNLLICNRH